jgi:hypothetical protein
MSGAVILLAEDEGIRCPYIAQSRRPAPGRAGGAKLLDVDVRAHALQERVSKTLSSYSIDKVHKVKEPNLKRVQPAARRLPGLTGAAVRAGHGGAHRRGEHVAAAAAI